MNRVLVLEDEFIIGMFIEESLSALNFEVSVFSEPEEVLGLPHFDTFDFCMFDISLNHELDGIDVYNKIKAIKELPIIFLTGNSDEKTAKKIATVNNLGVIKKPVNGEALQQQLQKILLNA